MESESFTYSVNIYSTTRIGYFLRPVAKQRRKENKNKNPKKLAVMDCMFISPSNAYVPLLKP